MDLSNSDDEVMALATEPTAYTFQSDLSSSDNDDYELNDAPPAEPIAASDLATGDIEPEAATPHQPASETAPRPFSSTSTPNLTESTSTPALLGHSLDNLATSALNGIMNGPTTRQRKEKPSSDVRIVDIEVSVPWMSPSQREDFIYIEVPDEDLDWSLRLRRNKTYNFMDEDAPYEPESQKRKRGNHYDGYDEESDFDEPRNARQRSLSSFGRATGRRSARVSTRASSHSHLRSSDDEPDKEAIPANESSGLRDLRPRTARNLSTQDNERDELQDSDRDDGTFFLVQSDIVPSKKKKLKMLTSSAAGRARVAKADTEFEARRSSRANKNTKIMTDDYDDEIFYVQETKGPGAPKVTSMKEIFQPAPAAFKEAHRMICDTCQTFDPVHKGALIHCQGCSNSYHRSCLGPRSAREQCVTKIGPDSFVLQCRFCLCNHKKKDPRAPSQDTCFGCNTKGASCAAFSEKKTAREEEKLRLANDGVDPVTSVAPGLVNNESNVLFRCCRCHRAAHYEHLPHPSSSPDPALADPTNLRRHRLEEYQVSWFCKECLDTEDWKVDKLVAWRPVNRDSYTKGQGIEAFPEDKIEYLVKWENKSYNHCTWMPGAWVHGICAASMRQSFIKHTFGEEADLEIVDEDSKDSLLRWTTKEAILDSWVTPEIILDVQFAPRTTENERRYRGKSLDDKMEDDKARVHHVVRIFVKFEGLSYEEAVWDSPPDPSSGAIWNAYIDAYHEFLIGRHFKGDSWRNMRERIQNFRDLDFASEIQVRQQPKGLKRGELMGYQLEGLNWMLYNFRCERNVILADEMGLGKTVQVVALLSSLIQDSPRIWPFLIVVPNSTCPNWRREIKKWAPELRVVAYYGGKVSQSLSQKYELFPNGSRDLKAHVVIMSYDSAKDSETKYRFNGVKWAGLVVDEAQALKNDENGLYRALSPLVVPFKLLLTGTPLQNNKRELFNLLQFVDPILKADALDEQFSEITKENLPKLHDLIRPYFLRRTKAQVLTFLPPMAQIILPVSMTVLQEKLCKSIMERNPQLIRSMFARDKMKASERGSLSNILMQLRKCLCHPFVYSQAVEDRNTDDELTKRNLIEASSKLMLLEVMLPKLKERGHRVLIFSQFLDQLTILEDFLTYMDLKYQRLDGNQSSLEKQKRIDAFNAPDSKLTIMLLSTRAGGVGINLATADTVIILDPDWNPHQDIQALSRAHRIGQKKKVLCFQIMTVDSAEEKILQIGRKKMALDHLLIESMDDKEGETANDVESVLKHGAAALFGEGRKKDAIVYDSAAVDKLLDRSAEEETKMDGDKSAESAFALARVWAQDEGLTDEVKAEEKDPSLTIGVWDKIIKEREEQARREAEKELQALGRGGRRRNAANYTGQKFDFGDGQEHLDSDQESVDADFVGGDSDGESSDANGESRSINGSNKKSRGSQGTKSNKITPSKISKSNSKKPAGSPVTPKRKTQAAVFSSQPAATGSRSKKAQAPKTTTTPRSRQARTAPTTPTKAPRANRAPPATPISSPRGRPPNSVAKAKAKPQQQTPGGNSKKAKKSGNPALQPVPPVSESTKAPMSVPNTNNGPVQQAPSPAPQLHTPTSQPKTPPEEAVS